MLATRFTKCAVRGCANPQNGLSDKCHRHDATEQRHACERCGADGEDVKLEWRAGYFTCPACGFVCTRCGEVGHAPMSVTWYDREVGPQSEDGCTGCLGQDDAA